MDKHVSKCTTELVSCKYSSIGCKTKVIKKSLPSHEEDCTSQHLKMATERIDALTKRLQALELKMNPVPVSTPPVIFKMSNFTQHKNNKSLWNSPAFFTHPRGYKMYVQVNSFGYNGRGKYSISVKVCLMSGGNDDSLVWPFRGVVSFQLMNQEADVNHRSGKAKFLEKKATERNRCVSVAQGKSAVGWGVGDMLISSEPEFWCYVQKDCLYIRVSDVEVAGTNKPWLL